MPPGWRRYRPLSEKREWNRDRIVASCTYVQEAFFVGRIDMYVQSFE